MNAFALLMSKDSLIINLFRYYFQRNAIEFTICPTNVEQFITEQYSQFTCIILDIEWEHKQKAIEIVEFLRAKSIQLPIILIFNEDSELESVPTSNIKLSPRNLSQMADIIDFISKLPSRPIVPIQPKESTTEQPTEQPTIEIQAPVHSVSNVTVLLADDSRPIRKYVTSLLVEKNCRVETFENGQELLNYLCQNKKGDIIILDNQMPVKDGITTLKELKNHEKFREIPVLFLSAITDKDHVVQALQLGADDYIEKPFHNDEFYARINVHLKIEKMKDELKKQNEQITEQKVQIEEKLEEIISQNEQITLQRDEIENQKNVIEKKNNNITASILAALRIQKAVLPIEEQIHQLLPRHFILFRPRDIVSGDFYFFKELDDFLIIAAADCTGHGIPGAFMSMLGTTILNEIVRRSDVQTAAQILNQLRDQLKLSLQQTGKKGEQRDGMDIAICKINRTTFEMQFAGAYNPLYLLRTVDDESEKKYLLKIYEADRMPIGGIHPRDKNQYTNHILQLQQGDRFYIFSDGYISQFGGTVGDKFKARRLQETLIAMQNMPISEHKEHLNKVLDEWRGRWEQVDDILIIGVEI